MSQNPISGRQENFIRESSTGLVLPTGINVATFGYSFAKHGGEIGTIHLPGDRIPVGAKVIEAFADVLVAVTSGGAGEAEVNVGSAALQAAAAVSGAPWSTVGLKDLSADPVPGTESGYLEPTNTSPFGVSFVISVAALTAGRVIFVVRYAVTEV